MKVGVVTPWYPTEDAPISGLFVQREVEAFRDHGDDVRVVHLDRSLPAGQLRKEWQRGVRVLRLGMNPASPFSVLCSVPKLREAVRGLDVVNTHAISALPVAIAARFQQPWVHTEHWSALSSPESASLLFRLVRPLFGMLLRAPDVVVAESLRLADAIRVFRGDRPVEIVPCIVPTPPQIKPFPGAEVRDATLKLVSTGGVIERKNPLLAVQTLAKLRDKGINASLRWVGEGNQKLEAQRLAAELGVEAEFLGGLSPSGVERELGAADIFFAPTEGENFFVAAAEALVNGRPICASDQGGHVEYALPEYSEIVGEQDPESYAGALVRLQEKTRGVSPERVSASVRDRFSPAAIAELYRSLYRSLLQTDAQKRGRLTLW